jgi:hypothetical protein
MAESMSERAPSRLLPLLLLFTALFTFLIQSGELGTADTTHRLQVTHSLWTGQPQVFNYEYPEFGLHGRGGRIYAWYGIGQSLLMLPADLIATAATHLPIWRDYVDSDTDPTIRSILVSISTNILLNVLTALVAFRLLLLLGFREKESIAGTLALLLATTHLHYAQNLQENNYILLLTLIGFLLQLKWLKTGSQRALFWGSMALGLNLLTRVTTMLDLFAAGGFILLVFWFSKRRSREGQTVGVSSQVPFDGPREVPSAMTYLRTALPVYAGFFFLDRFYQWIRFGSWTNTYVTIFAREERQIDPSLPWNYPFSGHFFAGGITSGMLGPFFAPEKTVFLFDPLFPLTLLVTVLLWKRLKPVLRAFMVTSLLLILAYLLFYARYFSWPGDFAWGDRYLSSAIQLSTLLTWPLLLRYRENISRGVWRLAIVVTSISVAIQCASLAFWVPLEIYQEETLGAHSWVVLLRFKNIIAFALGKREAWGLNTPAMFEDPWDARHITCWNFLPSLLRHVGVAPLWAVDVLYLVWIGVALAMIVTGVELVRGMGRLAEG